MDFILALTCGLAALALSLLLNRCMITLAPKLGLLDVPGERRIHQSVIPRAGGVAIWLSFMAVMPALILTGAAGTATRTAWEWFGAFGAGSLVLVAAGVIDDRFGLRPLVKLAAHIAAPTVMFALHPTRVGLFPESWWMGWDLIVFVLWSVALINAFNLIDGLDGLCGGLAALSCFILAGLALMNGRYDTATVLWVMAMCLAGFLWYNMNPARIFLGDAGSMLLGFFLATAATGGLGRKTVLGVILLPIAVAGVPLMDVLLAVWRRWMRRTEGALRGESGKHGIFEADREHLHHRMLGQQGSQRKVAIMMQTMAAVVAALCLLPLLFGDRMLRFSLFGGLLLAIVAVRRFARIEIERTGEVLHLAIKMPARRRRLALWMFCYDTMVLVAAGIGSVLLESNLLARDVGWDMSGIVFFVTVFVICGLLCIFGARVHQRLWARATSRDILAVGFWMVVCGVSTFCLVSLMKADIEWSVLRASLVAFLAGFVLIGLPRLALDALREFAMEHRVGKGALAEAGNRPGIGPVLVVGAGDMGTLFMDHLKASARSDYEGMGIVGFADDNEALHGRMLRSFRILGGTRLIGQLAAEGAITGVVLAIANPPPDFLERIYAIARMHHLKIYRWRAAMIEVDAFPETDFTGASPPHPNETPPGKSVA